LTKYKAESAKVLDRCKQAAEKSGVNIETVLAEGDAATNIVGYAQRESFDLVVIGSRGLGKFKEMVLGSTSSKVLHYTKSAVLIVR
jgi:nucleotide-binding universal stress UspA family protein